MAIVMDMCSGEVEMKFISDANQGGLDVLPVRNPAFDMSGALQLGMTEVEVAAAKPQSLPAFMATMDVETFLQAMDGQL